VYEIAEDELDALSLGRGGPNAIRSLRRIRETKHQVMLQAIRELAPGAAPDSISGLENAYGLLNAARDRDETAAATVLGHPAVGAWLASCLRRLVGATDSPDELGQLGAIAAATAIRAGLPFETTVPCPHGRVYLPGLGLATGDGNGSATIRSDGVRTSIDVGGCRVTVPDDPTQDIGGWLGLRRLRSTVDGVTLEVELNDLDPARSGYGLPLAGRLDADECAAWQELVDAAWHVLVRDHPDRAAELSVGLTAIVPLVAGSAATAQASTARDAFGSMCAARTGTARTFADSLVHEFQHSKLYALADIAPLHTADAEPAHYSPWREDPRPLEGLLHGAYSYVGVTDFWDVQRHLIEDDAERDYAEFEFCRWSRQVVAAIDVVLESGYLTDAGIRLAHAMKVATDRWQAVPASPRLRRLADIAIVDHRARWGLRNRRPDPKLVGQLADEWQSGAAGCSRDVRDVSVTVAPSPRDQPMSERLRLTQRWLLRLDPEQGSVGPNPADVALLKGELDPARAGYLAQIAATPDDIEAWAGLALSRYDADFRTPQAPMWTVPEVLLAVHRELRARDCAPDMSELAAWLSSGSEPAHQHRPEPALAQ
jgi:HEXXH motif-containing protein